MYMLTPVRPGEIYQPRIWAKGVAGRPRNSLTVAFLFTPPARAEPAGANAAHILAPPRTPGPHARKVPRGDPAGDPGSEQEGHPPPHEKLLGDPSGPLPRSPGPGQWGVGQPNGFPAQYSRASVPMGPDITRPCPQSAPTRTAATRLADGRPFKSPGSFAWPRPTSVTRLARAGPSPLPLGRSF